MIKKIIQKLYKLKNLYNDSPVSLLTNLPLPYGSCFSDLYPIFSAYSSEFLLVNPLAQLLGKEIKCKHLIYKFTSGGKIINIHKKIESKKFSIPIQIDGLDGECFSHHIIYNGATLKEVKKVIDGNLVFNNRSYCSYTNKNDGLPIGLIHGNYGNVFFYKGFLKPFARQTNKHTYTPSIAFDKSLNYDLVLINPTINTLQLSIRKFYNNFNLPLENINIEKLSWKEYKIRDYQGMISLTSKYPMTRPIVIEKNNNTLDIYHS